MVLDLWGAPDPDSPRSVTASELEAWAGRPGITWHGATRDVRALAACDIVMLLSRGGDGLPRALIEAAACGRPIIATDAPGCRTAVADGINGILVPVGDIEAAAQAIQAPRGTLGAHAHGCSGAHAVRRAVHGGQGDRLGARGLSVAAGRAVAVRCSRDRLGPTGENRERGPVRTSGQRPKVAPAPPCLPGWLARALA